MWTGISALALSAYGQYSKGQADQAAGQYNSALAAQNSRIALEQGDAAVEMQKRSAARTMGTQIANYGASGVGGAGSALDVLSDSARMATLDQLTTKYNYQLRSIGYLAESALDSTNADNAAKAGNINAGAAALKGTASILSKRSPGSGPVYTGSGAGLDIPSYSDSTNPDY